MKVIKFSLQMLGKEKKKSLFYIMSCTFSVMVTFLFLNIIYNHHYYGDKQIMAFGDYNSILSVMLSFLVITIVVAMSFYAYNFYLSSQTKEIGIFLLGGSKLSRLFLYLFSQNLFIYLISLVIGMVLGHGVVPLVNLYIAHQMNIDIPVFVYSPIAFFGTIGIMLAILFYLAIVATGFIRRHEIKELIGMKKDMSKKDERMLNLPSVFYIVLFLSPIPAAVLMHNPELTAIFSFVAILGGYKGFCRYVLPPLIQKIQRKALLEHKIGLIASGNFHQGLVQTCASSQIFLIICIFMNTYMITNANNMNTVALIFVAYISLVISVSMGLLYKVLLEVSQRKITFNHLHKLGYTTREICKIIRQEVLCLYGMMALILLVYTGAVYLPYVINGNLEVSFMMQNMGIFLLAIMVTGTISYRTYKKGMMEEIRK